MKYYVKATLIVIALFFGFWFVGSTLIHSHDTEVNMGKGAAVSEYNKDFISQVIDSGKKSYEKRGFTTEYVYQDGEIIGFTAAEGGESRLYDYSHPMTVGVDSEGRFVSIDPMVTIIER